MRKLGLGKPIGDQDIGWAIRSLQKIDRATAEGIETVLDSFTVTGTYTETRTLDVDTATLPDLIAVFATMIADIKGRGQT